MIEGQADPGQGDDRGSGLSPVVIVRLLRGFTAVFWGLPVSLLLFFGAVDVNIVVWFRLPTYILGVAVVYIGLALLRFSGLDRGPWKKQARNGLIAAFLLIYLGPFVYWYSFLPRSGWYYLTNLCLLLGAAMWLLFAVNRLAGELGAETQDRDLMMESRLCSWSIVLLMVLPMILTTAFSSYMALKYESSLVAEMRGVRQESPWWIHIFFLIPLSLTMTSSWKAKEKCLALLKTKAA
jgi:hypothetical protein